MDRDDIIDLSNRVHQLRQSLNVLPRYGELAELLKVIHQPGRMNPSNFGRVSALVDLLYMHVCAMATLQRELSSATRLNRVD